MLPADIATLPYVRLEEVDTLPRESAIYFVLSPAGDVLYIGKSVDIHQRWRGHHIRPYLKGMEALRVAWYLPSKSVSMAMVETELLSTYRPPLNAVGGQRTRKPRKPRPAPPAGDGG